MNLPSIRKVTTVIRGPAYVALYAVVALAVLWIFCLDPGLNGFFCSKIKDMVYGTAFKPYVYRTLLPSTTRLILKILPLSTKAVMKAWVLSTPMAVQAFAMLKWEHDVAAEAIISAVLMYLCFLGFALSTRWLFVSLYETSSRMKDLLPVAALLGLPMFFAYSNYLYDPSTIFLFTFCLTLLVRRTWGRYLVAFAISALNKETTVLLGIIFALHHFPKKGRMDWRTYGTLLVPQVAIYLASRFALGKLFGNNPGDYFLWHLKDHQFPLLRAYQPSSYVTALALFCAVAGHWQEKPAVLKSGLWILVPLLGMAIFFGFMDEYRAFYEAYPLVLMLGAFTAARLMAVPLRTTELGAPT